MRQLQVIAENLLGEIRWHSNVLGYAQCPGKDLHSNSSGPRDCRITIDSAPTIYCVHNSCASVIGECNRRLRSNIAKATAQPKRWNNYKPQTSPEAIQNAKVMAILQKHAIDPKEIYQNSPDQLIGVSQPNLWRSFLGIFQLGDIVWIGDIKDSGSPRHSRHFKPVSEWLKHNSCPGPRITPSTYKSAVYSRSNPNVVNHRFIVIESDTRPKSEQWVIMNIFRKITPLRAVIDSGNKSLHAWFDRPNADVLEKFKRTISNIGADPAGLRPTQPFRMPGIPRENSSTFTNLLYLDPEELQ